MTSTSLLQMARRGAEQRLGRSLPDDADKRTIVTAVFDAHGSRAVVELGRGIRGLPSHPVLDAVTRMPDPLAVVERWMRLERFGHTHHRTRTVDAAPRSTTIEHVSTSGSAIHPLDDLFVWGLYVGLLERAGVTGASVELVQDDGDAVPLTEGVATRGPHDLPGRTDLARIRWGTADGAAARALPPSDPHPAAETVSDVDAMVRTDLVHRWQVAEVAKRLALSSRQLQRQLRAAGTTFGDLLQRSRVGAAHDLLKRTELSLVEVAFCTGFADAAHFSRTFRRLLEVPPSVYRELLGHDET
ncbi:MAG: helix-turn-helix transcriptional regulator [Myxococcota bacterium]